MENENNAPKLRIKSPMKQINATSTAQKFDLTTLVSKACQVHRRSSRRQCFPTIQDLRQAG